MNNQLMGIIGQVELLHGQTEGDPRLQADVELMLRSSQALARSIASLAEQPVTRLQPPRSIRSVVFGMRDLLRRLFPSCDLELIEADEGEPPLVVAGTGQIEFLIVSLLSAGRFLFGSECKLVLVTGAEAGGDDAAKARVALRVQDNSRPRSDVRAGSYDLPFEDDAEALRLAPGCLEALKIVRDLGGGLHRDVATGRDTTLTAYLPCRLPEGAHEGRTKPAPEGACAGRSRCVVLVEDDGIIRGFAQRALEGIGYRVYNAANATEAIQLVAQLEERIDLLLIDLVLPGMHGGRLARELRERLGNPRVLFITGYDDDAIQHHRLLEQGAELLHKPFDSTTLIQRVALVLEGAAETSQERG
ncbi:MAG: response regulator [Planctomycetes bacterium]|nr:response regulator [Planctomycetota bacterium]